MDRRKKNLIHQPDRFPTSGAGRKADMTPVISANALSKTYQSNGAAVWALRDVDLEIPPGEFVAVMGPSGCGKSTLLHLLGGLDRPTGGEIRLDGRRIDALSESQLAVLRRKQIGFVFQFFNLIGNLSAADNIELPALLAGMKSAEAHGRAKELLQTLGMDGKENAVPARLSGGEQQRVALARALVNRPALLLADEPTGNLDTQNTREVLRLLKQSHREGQSILMVTHDPRVASAADRVLYMSDGRIVDESRPAGSGEPQAVLSRFVQWEM
jgi:putative ABC transport system ATP-binding protein